MKVIGLTGGIGSGKSTVARFLAELGAVILDADTVGHEALKSNSEVQRQVMAAFGRDIVSTSGDIDRKKLGEVVFNSPDARDRLNRIMHPPMFDTVKTRFKEYQRQGVSVVILEAPLLVEAGWTPLVDEVWVTAAPEATIIKRLRERTGLSEAESQARIQAQLSSAERIKHADVVIDTDCSLDELRGNVQELWRRLQSSIQ